jgi:hypothetical protein
VIQWWTADAKLIDFRSRAFVSRYIAPDMQVGVGQLPDDPDSLPDVRSSGIVRSEHSPFRIEPHRGQVTEDDVKPSKSEHWRVLHEHESGSYFANDSRHLSP